VKGERGKGRGGKGKRNGWGQKMGKMKREGKGGKKERAKGTEKKWKMDCWQP